MFAKIVLEPLSVNECEGKPVLFTLQGFFKVVKKNPLLLRDMSTGRLIKRDSWVGFYRPMAFLPSEPEGKRLRRFATFEDWPTCVDIIPKDDLGNYITGPERFVQAGVTVNVDSNGEVYFPIRPLGNSEV